MVALPQWLEYVESEIGFILPFTQHKWLEQAIFNTANKHNLDSAGLWSEIHKDANIRHELFDAILILESRFFRHKPSFHFITELATNYDYHDNDNYDNYENDYANNNNYANKTNQRAQTDEEVDVDLQNAHPFRVWSVGCSEGQEVWTIVMCLAKANLHNFKVLGTDISTKAITSAKTAQYSLRERREIPEQYQSYVKDIDLTSQHQKGSWEVSKEIQPYASFVLNNIFMPASKQKAATSKLLLSYDVIICQNMLIYFRQFDQRDILSRLVKQCKVGGHIILAPGEAYYWKHPQMKKVANDKINAWKKIR